MNLVIQRQSGDSQCTPGEMFLGGLHFCYTLEPRKDQSQGKPYCIPAGTYKLMLGWSVHFAMLVPKVQNVPGFVDIEIHPGNFPANTHGCCLVGESESADFVGQSRFAFDQLIAKMNATVSLPDSITYLDPKGATE